MGFVKYDKTAQPATTVPTITVQRSGSLGISRAAYQLIGSPDAVEFFWDADRKMVGVGPSTRDALGSYPIRHSGPDNSERGPVAASALAFTKHIGLDLTEAQRWVVELEDGMLVFDVTSPAQAIKSRRAGGSATRKDEAAPAERPRDNVAPLAGWPQADETPLGVRPREGEPM
jgi:hypothetical protein